MRHTLVLSALLGTGLLAVTSISQAANNSLVFCSEGSPAGFDTAQYTTATDNDAAEPLYNRLAEFEKKAPPTSYLAWPLAGIFPRTASSTLFHLREGVKFHTTKYFTPTRDFNADDVLFTFNRMLDPQQPFRKAYPTEFPYFNGMSLNKNIAKVEKTGPLTVVMTLNSVDAAFIQNIAMSFAAILSAEYADQLLASGKPSDINQKPIGTGPFVFKSYQKDSNIRYSGNKQYWDPSRVKLDNLVFAINTDASVRVQKLKANECQITLHPRPADVTALKKTIRNCN
ncbi:ABC transporter substrate-binding protein [Pseudomonas lini]